MELRKKFSHDLSHEFLILLHTEVISCASSPWVTFIECLLAWYLLSVYIFGPSSTTTAQLYTVRAAELVLLAPLAGLPSDPRAWFRLFLEWWMAER